MAATDPLIPIRVLGPLSVTAADGSPIATTARKHAELLAILTVERSACSPERVADLLWRGAPPRSATSTLHGYVSRLRKLLGPTGSVRIDTMPAGYVLRCDGAATDLDLLDRLGQEGLQAARTDPAAAAVLLGRALDLWRGDPLPEIADIADYAPELARLDEMRSELTESAAAALRTVGDTHRAVTLLTSLCHRHPYREGSARALARALSDDGRTADALETIRRVRRRLGDDLGLDPSAETCALEAELLESPPPAVTARVRADRPRLIGRAAETALLDGVWRIGATRPTGVLLVGPSGIGKTALAEDLVARHGAVARRFVGRPAAGGTVFAAIEEMFGTTGESTSMIAEVSAHLWSDIHAHGRAVLLLDDLQWLDLDSARLLARVVSGMPRAPLTVIATCRLPDDDSVHIVRSALDRHGTVSEVTVRALSPDDIRQLIGDRFGDLDISPDVDDAELADQSLGNPALAQQLCDAVAVGSRPDPARPARDLVTTRVDELTAPARELVTVLAVMGGRLPADLWAELGAAGNRSVGVTLVRSGLTTISDEGALCVSHDSVREAILTTTTRAQRIAAHTRIASALTSVSPDDRSAIAVHLAESAVDDDTAVRAAAACLTAARTALQADADHRALDLARRGLGLPLDDDVLTVELHRIAGSAATHIGDFAAATASFDAAAEISRSRGDWPALADTALLSTARGVGGYWSGFGVVFSANASLVREALTHADRIHPDVAARLHAAEAARLTVLGMPGADDHLGAARVSSDGGSAVDYEIALAEFLLRWEPDQLEDRRKIARSLDEMSAGDVDRRATALHLQRVCALEAGDLRLARRTSAEFARLVGKRDGTDLNTMQLWWQVMLAVLRGDYDAARSLTERFAGSVGGLSERARVLTDASMATSRSIEAWHHGRLAAMLPTFDTLVDEIDDDFALVIALGAAESGDLDRALQIATELTFDADRWTGSRVVARVPLLIEALYPISRSAAHASAARDLCARLDRFVADWSSGMIVQWPGLVCLGPAIYYRGTARAILGADGADDLRAAASLARDTGARPYQARAERRLADLTADAARVAPPS
nr:BTAD domain-containing putative transcriptional regulator [Gordonia insulae]